MNGRILLADDDLSMLRGLELSLRDSYQVSTATTVETAKQLLLRNEIDVAVVDLNFEGQDEDGLDLIDFIAKRRPTTSVIVLSGDTCTKRVAAAARRTRVDFVVKGGDVEEELILAIERALQQSRSKLDLGANIFQTRSDAVKRVLALLDKIATSSLQSPILILGEPGTGKEHLARHVGAVLNKKVVATNMANHRAELADSVLFGHLKGSFTGADQNRTGLIEEAQNGILFLDEIGETPLEVQAKLLRVVQEKEFSAVGSTVVKKADIRFIAATNRDLGEMSASGTFRKDLLERLSTWSLRIPPLRERPEDVVFLTNAFLSAFVIGEKPFKIDPSGVDELLKYSWPGNVRELKNVIERISTAWETRVLDREAVRFGIYQGSAPEQIVQARSDVDPLSKEVVVQVLRACGGNRARTAKELNVHLATLYRKLRLWNIHDSIPGVVGRPSKEVDLA